MHQLRLWLISYIEHAFRDVVLGEGMTLYQAEFLSSYGWDARELERGQGTPRNDWRLVPTQHLFDRSDAIFFMDCYAKRYYSPAILRALLLEGFSNRNLYDSFMFDLSGFVKRSKQSPENIPFVQLYNTSQRAAFVRFLKYAVYNAPREFGTQDPLRILERIRGLPAAPKPRRDKKR